MQNIRSIIIDDNPIESLLLESLLLEHYSEVRVLCTQITLNDGIIAIRQHKPDVVFLDIDLPQHSGIKINQFLSADEMNFEIIFTTSHQEFAIEAFELSAIGYLIKPLSAAKLRRTIKRLKTELERKNALQQVKKSQSGQEDRRISIPSIEGKHFFSPTEIICLKADGAYTEVVTERENLYVGKNMKYFEDLLKDEKDFMRVHRSYIVNLTKVVLYKYESDTPFLTLKNNIQIQISLQKIHEFQERMKSL
jgi:two-component system LytT family response regulator